MTAQSFAVRVGSASRERRCACGQRIVFWRSAVTARWLPIQVGYQIVGPARQEGEEVPVVVLQGVNHAIVCTRRDRYARRTR